MDMEKVYAYVRKKKAQEALAEQVKTAASAFVAESTTLTDEQALAMPDLLKDWDKALAKGETLAYNSVVMKDGKPYRVAQDGGVTPQAHQVPGGDGMLAVYRPIDQTHAGTLEDPIPWVYGMDCTTGLYYSYAGAVWLCGGDMKPCTWAPGTTGVWQWEAVEV